jgi:hypothetical protein
MQFVMNTDNIGPMINQMVSDITSDINKEFCFQKCSARNTTDNKWKETLDLTYLPTKMEDIHIKMEQETATISVSGKSETNKTGHGGMTVFSTHIWSKQIKVPENVETKTLAAKMVSDVLILTAEYKSQEIKIETPNLD